MTNCEPDSSARPSRKTAVQNDRQGRLAQALRDNLARRKAQARSRQDDVSKGSATTRTDD
jgi:hypothetical protein